MQDISATRRRNEQKNSQNWNSGNVAHVLFFEQRQQQQQQSDPLNFGVTDW